MGLWRTGFTPDRSHGRTPPLPFDQLGEAVPRMPKAMVAVTTIIFLLMGTPSFASGIANYDSVVVRTIAKTSNLGHSQPGLSRTLASELGQHLFVRISHKLPLDSGMPNINGDLA